MKFESFPKNKNKKEKREDEKEDKKVPTFSKYIKELASSRNSLDRRAAASSEATLPETLSKLALDKDKMVRREVAENPNTPSFIFDLFAEEEKTAYVRYGVVINPKTPSEILVKFTCDKDEDVREEAKKRLAQRNNKNEKEKKEDENPDSSRNFKTVSSEGGAISLAEDLQAYPINGLEDFARYASDESEWVRMTLAKNPNTPSDILTKLASDKDEYVREAAAYNLNTPPETLAKLASDEEEDRVRRAAAYNINTPPETLAKLASDEEWLVRRGAAYNPNTSLDILTELASDKNKHVRKVAKKALESRNN